MKKILVMFAAVSAFAGMPAFAQNAHPALDPATVAATKEMLSAMRIRQVMLAGMQQMEQGMPAQLRQTITASVNANPNMSAEQKQQALAKMDASLPKVMGVVHSTLSDPALMDELVAAMVPVYASNYTTAEIKQLTAFYKSPLGQKMLASTPKVMGESMEVSNRIMGPRIQKLMADTMKSLAD